MIERKGDKVTSERLESIQAIFERFQIKSSTEKFLLYLHGLIARHVFENCGAGEAFSGYVDAWDLPREQIDAETLSALAEQLDETAGLDFIQTVTPDLIPGDLESLFAFLEQSRWEKTDRTLFYLLLKIWAVVQVQEEQLSTLYPASVTQLKTRDISTRLFAGYQSWIEKHPKYKNLQNFGENEFFETWRLAFGAPFRPEQVMVKGKLVFLFTKLREKDFPEGAILA